jgi:hypothetical protein
MNVLNRKMFANGGAAQAEPSIPELIGYYVSQGYNALEIKEMLPDLAMGDIEAAVSQLGGSINSAVASPGANEFEGNFNVFPQIPETTVTANQDGMTTMNPSFPEGATPPELPNLDDISIVPPELQEFLAATAQFGKDQQLIMLTSPNYSFNLSEEEARQILNMPSIDIDMIPPQMPSDLPVVEEDNLPEITDIGTSSDLSNLQIRDKTTNSIYNLPRDFQQQVEGGMLGGMTLYSIINNRNFEFSPDVAAILENFADMDEPFRISQRLGGSFEERRGTFASPGDFGYGAQEVGRQFGNIASPIAEGIAGFFGELGGGAAGRQAVKDFIPDVDISKEDIGLARLLQIPGVQYQAPEVYDASKDLSKIAEDNVTVETKEETPTTNDDAIGTPIESDAIAGETAADDETITGTSTNPEGTGDEPGKGSGEDKLPNINILDDSNDAAAEISNSIFNNKDTQRLMRNIGKGLTQYGNFAEGIGKGSAAAAEERVLEEQLAAQRKSEEAIAGVKPLLKPSDIKGLDLMAKELNTNVGFFEGGEASIAIMNDTISLFEEAVQKGVPITGLPGRFERFKDEAAAFAGYDKEASAATKIQNMIEQVKQRSIRAILQESGRTISDTDRDIVNRVFGDLDLTSPPGEILKKLKNARQSLVTSNIDKRDTISTTYKLMQNPAYGNVGTDAISSYKDLLEKIINTKDYSFSSPIILGNTDLGRSSAGIFIDAT